MAKLSLTVTLKRNDGSPIATVGSGDKATRSEAEAVIAADISQRVTNAQGAVADLVDAQTAFNS